MTFDQIVTGECFVHDGEAYERVMQLPRRQGKKRSRSWNALALDSGEYRHIACDEPVNGPMTTTEALAAVKRIAARSPFAEVS